MLRTISIICSVLGIIMASLGLIGGLSCIGKGGFDGIGVIFILPSFIALSIILLDLLITVEFIKSGFIFSCISSIIKIGAILYLLPSFRYDYTHQMHNYKFFMIVFSILFIVTIPSILNVISFVISKIENSKSIQSES